MNMNLVQKAVNLFIETMPLDTMNVEDIKFMSLYEKECQIFVLFDQMTMDEIAEYRVRVSSL